MYRLMINGQEYMTDEDMNLLEYLREKLDITSVKNGCGEGACGACSLLIDGKKMRACLLTTAKADGKEILTVEGLTQEEKNIYNYSFSKVGAVQCGFCIPGMVISAKSLLDNNLNPTEKDIRQAIKGNICRCTGYKKIVQAIFLAAKCFRGEEETVLEEAEGYVGERSVRPDAEEKILATGKFADDIKADGMVYGSALRSKYPRALVKSIDIKKAMEHPDVVKIVLAEDVPGDRVIGHLTQDWPALIAVGEETRYLGDAVALVAAKSRKALEEIKKLIVVEYEERRPIFDPKEAMESKDYKIHESGNIYKTEYIKRGDVDKALKESAYVVTNIYKTPAQEHGFLEPESALAVPEKDGGLTVYTGGQSIYDEYREIQKLLGIDKDKLRIKSAYVGGGFGGKEDMSVQHHAALLAYLSKVPVKVTLTREESLMVHPKRHPMEMELTTGCDKNGKLTAIRLRLIADTGAYASLGGPVLQRACTHAGGPYNYQDIDIVGTSVYTNNVPSGAFRGFGVTQTMFATECNLNLLAEKVGIDPYEIRYLNALRPGQVLPNGQIADDSTAIVETLEAVKDAYYDNYDNAGIACAIKNAGVGVGVPDTGRVKLKVINGKVSLRTSAACMGQGIASTMRAICCETTNLKAKDVIVAHPDTAITPDSGTSTASRQTVITGETTRRVSLKLEADLEKYTLEELEGKEYYEEFIGVTDPMGSEKANPVSHLAYGYATQVVILNEEGKVKKVVAAHDVGRAINPSNVEGQLEGGIVMGLGYGLTENPKIVNGKPTVKYGTLGLWRATDVPEIETIIIEKNNAELAYGAKGVGEIPLIPTSPAAQAAYYKRDGIFRTSLPLENTPYTRK
ncbi:selenium-dependent xanthine dehydrogenase [uncultured Clostridium sp.]|uniref:selenium-dependent xanthine dehydrogenase n=1 Tax=uncultured Clostridium sp. TaxID=59620 RepID=UPI0025D8A293|nr:selenium-dependent xanthine dehydrogenase [uncultured Clostridium sp.]